MLVSAWVCGAFISRGFRGFLRMLVSAWVCGAFISSGFWGLLWKLVRDGCGLFALIAGACCGLRVLIGLFHPKWGPFFAVVFNQGFGKNGFVVAHILYAFAICQGRVQRS